MEVNKMTGKPVFFKLKFLEEDPNTPMTPQAHILVRHDDTYAHLSPILTAVDFDGYIDYFIEELEQIRCEAKRKFSSLRSEQRLRCKQRLRSKQRKPEGKI